MITHEAVHVALPRVTQRAPAWLAEGLADHVALAAGGVPVTVAAAQALEGVRRRGAPTTLPTRARLSGARADVGAAYESAWLAVRLVAERLDGPARLLRFARTAARDGEDRAFRQLLGTDRQRFVARWRADLARLADRPAP